MMMKRKVTIDDVARAAGVSKQTVSRAINDKGEIHPDTKARIMDLVEAMGYQPNRLAQSMVTQRTMTIGLVMADITNLFFPEVARGVQDACSDYDYNVFLCNSDDNPKEELKTLYSLASHQVDGIIMASSNLDDAALTSFADAFAPIILINRTFDHPNVEVIQVDNVAGGRMATRHLIELGHRNIGMLAPFNYPATHIKRVQGYEEALRDSGLESNPNNIVRCVTSLKGGYEGMKVMLTEHPDITAVFSYNDVMALGAMRACSELGKRVPDDIAIIGFDDISLTAMVTPSLSSVNIDKYALGQLSFMRLRAMMEDGSRSFDPIQIELQVMARESTASAT